MEQFCDDRFDLLRSHADPGLHSAVEWFLERRGLAGETKTLKRSLQVAEKDLPWDKVDVDLPGKANLDPAYLKLNPLGVVPTLVDDGVVEITSGALTPGDQVVVPR